MLFLLIAWIYALHWDESREFTMARIITNLALLLFMPVLHADRTTMVAIGLEMNSHWSSVGQSEKSTFSRVSTSSSSLPAEASSKEQGRRISFKFLEYNHLEKQGLPLSDFTNQAGRGAWAHQDGLGRHESEETKSKSRLLDSGNESLGKYMKSRALLEPRGDGGGNAQVALSTARRSGTAIEHNLDNNLDQLPKTKNIKQERIDIDGNAVLDWATGGVGEDGSRGDPTTPQSHSHKPLGVLMRREARASSRIRHPYSRGAIIKAGEERGRWKGKKTPSTHEMHDEYNPEIRDIGCQDPLDFIVKHQEKETKPNALEVEETRPEKAKHESNGENWKQGAEHNGGLEQLTTSKAAVKIEKMKQQNLIKEVQVAKGTEKHTEIKKRPAQPTATKKTTITQNFMNRMVRAKNKMADNAKVKDDLDETGARDNTLPHERSDIETTGKVPTDVWDWFNGNE